MIRTTALALGLALVTSGVTLAQTPDPIETRQAGQDLLSGDFAGIRAVVAAKGDVKTLENPAKAMARWMKQFPTQFPKGSETGHNTKAKPEVWSDNAGFLKAADTFVEASTKLAELAKAGDTDGVTAQVKVVADACSACHRGYLAR